MNPFRKPDELKVSETVRQLNPHLFNAGGLGANKPQRATPLGQKEARPGRSGSGPVSRPPHYRVSLIAYVHRVHDRDNLIAGFKPLRDAVARRLGLDDRDDIISWDYGQCVSATERGTIVRITCHS
jgi:hypothetical protein